MTIGQGQLELAELEHIADLLMGAAYADGRLEGSETEAVRKILGELVEGEVPVALLGRIDNFDPGSFDVGATCRALQLPGHADRRALLALLAHVSDADDVHDLDESAYIRKVADAIGARDEDCAGLAAEVVHVRLLGEPPGLPE